MKNKWGPQIDEFDAVVRLKWGHTGTGDSPEQFGARMDYLCSTLHTWKRYAALEMREYWGYENVFCGRNHYPIQKALEDTPLVVEQDAINYWNEVYTKLRDGNGEPHYSTGMAATIMACARIKPEVLTLVGFDNVLSGERDNYKSVFREDGFTYPDHRWDVEYTMVPLVTEYYGCKLAVLQ